MISSSPQQQYEQYLIKQEHNAVKRFPYKDYQVYISEGGPYYIRDYPQPEQVQAELNIESAFWYETAYAIGRDDNIVFWQPIVFDGMHDIATLTLESRLQARINSAIKTAKEVINGEAMFLENYLKDAKDVKAMIHNA